MNTPEMSRRQFLQLSSVLGAGLYVGVAWAADDVSLKSSGGFVDFGSWLRMSPEGKVYLVLDRVEMGQGTMTSHAMMVAEELELDPSEIIVEFAKGLGGAFVNPALGVQLTGGSTSVSGSWLPLRMAAAQMREKLKLAAALKWSVWADDLKFENGFVSFESKKVSAPKSERQPYSYFILDAQSLEPKDVKIKDPKDFKVLGKSIDRKDAAVKVAGKAVFGIDVVMASLLNCYVVRCPFFGGQLKSFDDAEVKTQKGVQAVVALPNGVGVVAEHWYQAKKAASLLKVVWAPGSHAQLNSTDIDESLKKALLEPGKEVKSIGDINNVRQKAVGERVQEIAGEFNAPFLAHVTLEPQNATAFVTEERCEIWAPTQAPQMARQRAVEILNMPHDKVTVHQTFLGGGFGRRIAQDYIDDAVRVSAVLLKPVKVIWTREDDIKHDFYRPIFKVKFKASLDFAGQALGLEAKIASPSILHQVSPDFVANVLPTWVPGFLKEGAGSLSQKVFKSLVADDTATEGLATSAYSIPNFEVRYVRFETAVPVGFWRSVGHSANGFVMEGIVSEMAFLAKKDPFEFRRSLLIKSPKHIAVLDILEKISDWKKPSSAGVFKGMAICESFKSVVGNVIEIKVTENQVQVLKVFSVVNCGFALNPDIVKSQVEGSVVFGLSAALKQQITFANGQVEQSNFHDFEVLRHHECPVINVHIVPSAESPTGIGEPGLPPVAPALADAIYAATGKRLRSLPFKLA